MKIHDFHETTIAELTAKYGFKRFQGKMWGFDFSRQNLTSMVGLPSHLNHSLSIAFNPKIKSLEGLPVEIDHALDILGTGITSLKGIERLTFRITGRKGLIKLDSSKIKSHVLGLLRVKGLGEVNDQTFLGDRIFVKSDWEMIIAPYLFTSDRSNELLFQCQNELIDAGLEEHAQL